MARSVGDHGKMVLEQKRLRLDQERLKHDRHRLTLDDYKANLDRFKAEMDADKPYVEGVMRFAELSVRSLLILNGGSAIALLAFAGNAATKGGTELLDRVAPVLATFGWGAALSVATACGAYLAQGLFIEGKMNPRLRMCAIALRVASILCGLVALSCFVAGMIAASTALSARGGASAVPSRLLLIGVTSSAPRSRAVCPDLTLSCVEVNP